LASLASWISFTETDNTVKGILDLPLVVEGANVNGFFTLQFAVAAYNYRISLDNLDDVATASAWFDLGMALGRFSTQTKDEAKSNRATQQADHCVQRALLTDPGNNVYWNALGNLKFVENPKMSQHAYIKALECDTKVGSSAAI
jgi:superkiller protein 3